MRKGFCQPYAAWYGLTGCFVMTLVGGYTVFLKGSWDVPTFLFSRVFEGDSWVEDRQEDEFQVPAGSGSVPGS